MKFQLCLVTVVLSTVLACGGGKNPDREAIQRIPDDQKVGEEKVEVVTTPETPAVPGTTDSLTFSEGMITGTGSVRFAEDLGGVETAYHFLTEFELQEGGFVTLISHADVNLVQGVELKLTRQGSALLVSLTADGITDDWSSFFSGFDATGKIKLALDVHNNEAQTHILVWNDLVSEVKTVIDSGVDVDGTPGKGRGQNWGLKMKDAKVLSIVKGQPRHDH